MNKTISPATNSQVKSAFAAGFVSAEMAQAALRGDLSARRWVTEATEHYRTEGASADRQAR
jgi:hypothetical protein